jgi:hypothetical protein
MVITDIQYVPIIHPVFPFYAANLPKNPSSHKNMNIFRKLSKKVIPLPYQKRGALIQRAEIIPLYLIRVMPA